MTKLSNRILYNDSLSQANEADLVSQSILRNLQAILNTRSGLGVKKYIDDKAVLDNQTFGLPDFTFLSLSSSSDTKTLQKIISKAIKHFEPRLQDVVVNIGDYNSITRKINVKVSAYFNRNDVIVNFILNLSTMEFLINESGQ